MIVKFEIINDCFFLLFLSSVCPRSKSLLFVIRVIHTLKILTGLKKNLKVILISRKENMEAEEDIVLRSFLGVGQREIDDHSIFRGWRFFWELLFSKFSFSCESLKEVSFEKIAKIRKTQRI